MTTWSSSGSMERSIPRVPRSCIVTNGSAKCGAQPVRAKDGSSTSEATRFDDALEELLRPRFLGLAEDLRGGPLLEDHPFVQEAHLVGVVAREAHLVRGDQHRHPARRELA